MKRIYLDYAATSPVKPEVLRAMEPYFKDKFGNPSSIHSFGREAREGVDQARNQVAKFLHCKPEEVIFTSGGTEADNMAITGVIASSKFKAQNSKLHIITTQIEHHAVLNTCKALEKEKLAQVTYLKPSKNGLVTSDQVKKAIKSNTVLVSIIYVNNEIGSVQPIREIGKLIEKENKTRENKIYFHTDAVQAAGYFSCEVDFLHVDLLSISAHKFGGSKGVGALFIRKGTKINPILFGGEQEGRLRAGTENMAGIVGLGRAVAEVNPPATPERSDGGRGSKQLTVNKKILKLKNYLIDGILKRISKSELNGSRENSSPAIANFYFPGAEGESIVLALDLAGVACSTGSACASVSLEPSHVISACFDAERAHGSIRFSLGGETTEEEIDYVLKILPGIIERLRKVSKGITSTNH